MKLTLLAPALLALAVAFTTTSALPVDEDSIEARSSPESSLTERGGGGDDYYKDYYSNPKKCPKYRPYSYPDPRGYKLDYGPICAANNAPGYMGYHFLPKYDPKLCAKYCDEAFPDAKGGPCKYFNIWEGEIDKGKKDPTYTCSLYYKKLDKWSATNYGDGVNKVKVTNSRGYYKKHGW
jgi:hypothetical protein